MGHRVKKCKRYMMRDKRWKDVDYPGKMNNGETNNIGNAGCGPCACAAIVASHPNHRNVTPETTAKWILKHEGIGRGEYGTPWPKLVSCMKHYGFTAKRYTKVSEFLSAMNKKQNNCAILHFTKGSRNNYHWAISGHYVACSGIKEENGKHYLYVLDSSYKYDHEGWYCYEDTMKGLLDYAILCRTDKVKGTEVKDIKGIIFGWPCPGHKITSKYGPRGGGWHQGVDIGAPSGSKIVAAADGKVVWPSPKTSSARGNQVLLYHGKTPKGKDIYTRYQHNSKNCVSVGDVVKRGDKIAEVGSTGFSTGPHLHFEVMIGGKKSENIKTGPQNDVNPEKFIKYGKLVTIDGVVMDDDDTGGGGGEGEGSGTGQGLAVSPEQLYSSNNYEYVIKGDNNKKSPQQLLRENIQKIYDEIKTSYEQNKKDREEETKNFFKNILDTILKLLGETITISDNAAPIKSSTMKSGSSGKKSVLPVVSTLVEAPYFEVSIGGVTFGSTKKRKIPNYVKSITVEKTNASVSEYTIQLIHQIRVGDNPNYIDSALSAEGFNKIQLKYGNANTGQIFSDNEALIVEVVENFDFTNCNIIYNIKAVSTSATSVSSKRDYPAYNGKPSKKIKQLLWDDLSSGLLDAFPGMKNKLLIESKNFIPTNDASVSIGAVQNISPIEYVSLLTGMMVNELYANNETSQSMYVLTVNDSSNGNQFKITEVKSTSSTTAPFMYEVNVGYPDDNFVIDFQVNNNFAWSVVYEGSRSIPRYDYSINGSGGLDVTKIPSYYKNEDNAVGEKTLWSSLTRYPIEATLIVRGLLQDSLLMQYVRVNQYLYGAKRINSGMYIVLGQIDSIGNGVYSTALKLMRVAGDNEYITLDGRKRV